MRNKDDGGTAFPATEADHGLNFGNSGMSLRDYFAAKFIAAWVVALGARHGQPGYSDRDAMWEAIRLGTEQADVMLAERAK